MESKSGIYLFASFPQDDHRTKTFTYSKDTRTVNTFFLTTME